jgi:hypothetical protein
MIPNDLASRLRILTEKAVQPLNAVQEIASDLPAFDKGQRFTAKLEAALPDGTFKAVVAGRTVTLSLPQAAKAGDALDLVVVERTPRLIVATQADPATPTGSAPAGQSQGATLSQAARLIATLLAGEAGPDGDSGGKPNSAAAASRTEPLLPTAPQDSARLAAALRSAVADSGAFYEANQARWVRGELPTEALLQQPQGRHSPLLQAHPVDASGQPAPPANQPQGMAAPAGRTDAVAHQAFPVVPASSAADRAAPTAAAPVLPSDLAPVVRQQLETLNTQAFSWHGQVWPGQDVDWAIAEHEPGGDHAGNTGQASWTTSLRLALPRLGEVSASLQLAASGISVLVRAESPPGAAELRAAHPLLAASLAAAGLRLLTLGVERGEPG